MYNKIILGTANFNKNYGLINKNLIKDTKKVLSFAIQVNIKPIGAILFIIKVKFLILKMKFKIDNKAKQVNEARPIQAAGT